ncbi:MAG: glycosyltransferase family 4 protein [Verrucomicrobiota bacterium]
MKEKRTLMLGYLVLENDPRVLREAEALRDAGWDVDVIGLGEEGKGRSSILSSGIRLLRTKTKKYRGDSTLRYMLSYAIFAIEAIFSVFAQCFKHRYSTVHVHTMPDLLAFCALPAKLWGCKVVLDIHDTVPEVYQDKFDCDQKHPLIRFLLFCEKISARFADQVITVNYEHADLVNKRTGLKTPPAVIFNAVDQNLFKARGIQPQPPLRNLIVHGTLGHRHGIDRLIEAMPKILEKEPETKLRIYGNGDAVPELRELITKLQLEEAVHLPGKYFPLSEMAEFVSQGDIGIIPYRSTWSTKYMLPTKLLEYLSVGLAVVTSETLPIRSMFEGRLKIWDDENPETLANLVLEQIRNPDFPPLPREMQWSLHRRELISLYSMMEPKPKTQPTQQAITNE